MTMRREPAHIRLARLNLARRLRAALEVQAVVDRMQAQPKPPPRGLDAWLAMNRRAERRS